MRYLTSSKMYGVCGDKMGKPRVKQANYFLVKLITREIFSVNLLKAILTIDSA